MSARGYCLGVCGFPRCGSSMTMRMLDAGGLPPIVGSSSGSYELPGLDTFAQHDPAALIGRAVKLLDYVQWFGADALPAVPWRFLWLDRDGTEQARSMVKFTSFLGVPMAGDAVSRLRRSYKADRGPLVNALREVGPVEVLRFEDLIAAPHAAGMALAAFCGINAADAAEVVMARDAKCAPDMAVELAAIEAAS